MERAVSSSKKRKPVPDLPPLDPGRRYSIDAASDYLDQCRAQTYLDIAADRLESFKDGRRRYVTGRSIAARMVPDE